MYYITRITIVLYLTFFISTFSRADIITAPYLYSVKPIFYNATNDTLVIFDIDHVVAMPTDESSLNRSSYRKQLWSKMRSQSKEASIEFYRSIATRASKWKLVDPCIISIIEDLEKRHIDIVALTSMQTGRFGVIEKMENLRLINLSKLGINFSRSSPIKDHIVATPLKGKYGVPMIKDGVIFTAEQEKGKILEYMFKKSNYFPKNIIFIDDKLENIESVKKMCQKYNIKFHAIHYIAVSLMPEPLVDKNLEDLRFKILKEKSIWLDYEELRRYQNRIKLIHTTISR
jgi:hypothetical protein